MGRVSLTLTIMSSRGSERAWRTDSDVKAVTIRNNTMPLMRPFVQGIDHLFWQNRLKRAKGNIVPSKAKRNKEAEEDVSLPHCKDPISILPVHLSVDVSLVSSHTNRSE